MLDQELYQHNELASVGRNMMDYSENYGRDHGLKAVTDLGLSTLNNLSRLGSMLTQYGTTWGTTLEDFTEDDLEFISLFMQGKVSIERSS